MTLGTELKKYRIVNCLTLDELSKKSGISRVSLCLYESDKKKPRLSNIKKLARILNFNETKFLEEHYL